MAYNNRHTPALGHLKAAAQRAQAMVAAFAAAAAADIDGLDELKADKPAPVTINIPVSAWTTHSDAEYQDYGYRASVAVTGLTADDYTHTDFGPAAMAVALAAGMATTSVTATGAVRFYARKVPTAALTGQLTIIQGRSDAT